MMEPDKALHISVMPKEAMELLALPYGGVAVDGTLGLGGHAALMAEAVGRHGQVIGIDRDKSAIEQARKQLSLAQAKIDLVQGNFCKLNEILASLHIDAVDGILLDLGISSFQLDDAQRGFAFKTDGPLDMRMDPNDGASAADLVNTLKESELQQIIFEFGEERFAKRIAAAIVMQRAKGKIATTKALADLVLRALPHGYTRGRIHPATRTFQALRIAVNEELEALSLGLEVCFRKLKKGGRLCVIAFHSLEDRLVKVKFKSLAAAEEAKILTKKPLEPTEQECESNSRSRSAKLRVVERT